MTSAARVHGNHVHFSRYGNQRKNNQGAWDVDDRKLGIVLLGEMKVRIAARNRARARTAVHHCGVQYEVRYYWLLCRILNAGVRRSKGCSFLLRYPKVRTRRNQLLDKV